MIRSKLGHWQKWFLSEINRCFNESGKVGCAMIITRQQLFDNAAKGLLGQMRKSLLSEDKKGLVAEDYNGNCAYRGKDGTKCAIGFSIPDNEYSPTMEGKHPTRILPIDYNDFRFVGLLQSIHDSCDPEEWKERLLDFAKEFELNTEIIHD